MYWMDASGVLNQRYDEVDNIVRARRVPPLQLGTPDRSTLDLNGLTVIGVRLVGRLVGITENGKAQFAGSLRNMCALSDLKMGTQESVFLFTKPSGKCAYFACPAARR